MKMKKDIMTIEEFQKLASRTFNSKDLDVDIMHVTLGMVTESAEIADAIKKHIAYGKEIDVVNIKEELGDLLWYIAIAMDIFEFEPSDVFKTNIEKLKVRYPEKYSDSLAENRNLEAERKTLESTNN